MRSIKALGQNFLSNPHMVHRIVERIEKYSPETILEIGPGTGALTLPLCATCSHIITIEKDPFLADQLGKKLASSCACTATVLNDDFMNIDLSSMFHCPFQVVGSLPFNIARRIILKIFEERPPTLTHAHCIVQKEVAERYIAVSPRASSTSFLASLYGTSTVNFTIPRTCFSPRPKVDAALLTITFHTHTTEPAETIRAKSSFYKLMFKKPRKTVHNNMKPLFNRSFPLQERAGTEVLRKRPAELEPAEMEKLFILYNTRAASETRKKA